LGNRLMCPCGLNRRDTSDNKQEVPEVAAKTSKQKGMRAS